MQLAFLMPSEAQRQKIGVIRESVVEMRPDQIQHLEHLLRSWGVFGSPYALGLTSRAIKRTLRDKS